MVVRSPLLGSPCVFRLATTDKEVTRTKDDKED